MMIKILIIMMMMMIMIMMIDDSDDDCDGDNRTYGFNQYLLVTRDHRSIQGKESQNIKEYNIEYSSPIPSIFFNYSIHSAQESKMTSVNCWKL